MVKNSFANECVWLPKLPKLLGEAAYVALLPEC
jgi:hypothetical protein